MKQFTWFVLAIKCVGVLLIGMSLSSLFLPLQWIAMIFEPSSSFGSVGQIIAFFVISLGPLVQFAFGLYLLLGGRQIINRCLRMVDGHCIVCGYDVRGLDAKVCPECGTSTTGFMASGTSGSHGDNGEEDGSGQD